MLFLIFTTAFSIRWRQDKLIELSTLALLINVQCTKYIQYHGKSGTSAQLTQSQAANFEWNEFLTSLTGGVLLHACTRGPPYPAVMLQSHYCSAAVAVTCHTLTLVLPSWPVQWTLRPWDNGAQTSVQWTQSAAATIILELETKVHSKVRINHGEGPC